MATPRIPERNSDFRDARNLLFYIIKRVIPGAPDPTPVQYDICLAMQEAMSPVVFPADRAATDATQKLVVEGFRGVAKSLIASVMTIWALYWNPNLNILVVSASKERADAFSTFTLRCIRELPQLAWLQPGPNGRDSMVSFDVGPAPAAHAPSAKSVGITGMITGSRADIIFADDIEVPNNSETDQKRLKLAELVKEFASVAKPRSCTIFLGTPQIEMSLYNTLTSDRGYRRRIWPARYPGQEWMHAYGSDLSPMLKERLETDPALVGRPTDPDRFDDLVLLEKEAEYARSGFNLQFMLDTSLSDAARHPLKLSDIVVLDFGEERAPINWTWTNDRAYAVSDIPSLGLGGDRLYRGVLVGQETAKFEGAIMTIDPSGRGKDALGLCVSKVVGANIYVPLLRGLFGGYQDGNLIRICELAKEHKVRKIIPESNFGNGMFTALLIPHLRRIYPDCAVEEIHSIGQKEKRIIETLEPVLNQHRLVFSAQVLKDDLKHIEDVSLEDALSYRFAYQLTRITKERGSLRHDDLVDVLSMAVSYWVNHMMNMTEAARTKALAREYEDLVQAWYRDDGRPLEQRPRVGHSSVTLQFLKPRT